MEDVDGYGMQMMIFPLERFRHVPRPDQFALGVIDPAVIRAGELSGIAGFIQADHRSAVAADVGERPNLAILPAHDDCGLVGHVENLEIPRLCDFRLVPGTDPVPHDDLIQFEPVDLGIDIESLLQRPAGSLAGNEFANGSVVLHDGAGSGRK